MTLRIERQASTGMVTLQLVGCMCVEHLDELKAQIDAAGSDVVLEVAGLILISIEGIRFLNNCEDEGITVANPSPYIAEWKALERRSGSKGL